jgi:hydroxypyruvate reductase 1
MSNPEGNLSRHRHQNASRPKKWLEMLTRADCRIEVCKDSAVLGHRNHQGAIGHRCDGAIGQLTEPWGETLFDALKAAGGVAYSNYAVGYNNVDLDAATRAGIPVGNTPGVLTETTAEMAVALTFAAARRVGEAERYLRAGRYTGWLPDLFLGTLLHDKTLGIIGAGRIGSAFARMMVQGHGMQVIYHDPAANTDLESFVADYNRFRAQPTPATRALPPGRIRRGASGNSGLRQHPHGAGRHHPPPHRCPTLGLDETGCHIDQHQPRPGN